MNFIQKHVNLTKIEILISDLFNRWISVVPMGCEDTPRWCTKLNWYEFKQRRFINRLAGYLPFFKYINSHLCHFLLCNIFFLINMWLLSKINKNLISKNHIVFFFFLRYINLNNNYVRRHIKIIFIFFFFSLPLSLSASLSHKTKKKIFFFFFYINFLYLIYI